MSLRATIIAPPKTESPPSMPVDGAVAAEVFDSLGWGVHFLDVAAFSMTAEAVRVEVQKEDPNVVIFMVDKNQYRYAKQYVAAIRGELPRALLIGLTDLKPTDVKAWLKLDFVVKGPPQDLLRMISKRTQTRNLEGVPSVVTNGQVSLPQYHPLTTNFEQYARLRGGRFADIPVALFGQNIPGEEFADAAERLRLKYAAQGFNLTGDIEAASLLMPMFRKLEDRDLVGQPANLSWTCTIPNPMELSTPAIRQLADHGVRVLTFEWRAGIKDQIKHVIDTASKAGIQPMIRLLFGGDGNIYDYVEMAKLLQANEALPVQPRFVEDGSRMNDEEYVASLSNGLYLPKSQNLNRDMQLLAVRDLVLARDVERLERYAEYTSH